MKLLLFDQMLDQIKVCSLVGGILGLFHCMWEQFDVLSNELEKVAFLSLGELISNHYQVFHRIFDFGGI